MMNTQEDWVIAQFQKRIREGDRYTDKRIPGGLLAPIYPPVSEAEMEQAEKLMGFRLPPFMRRLYLEIADGGFGPGLLPLLEVKNLQDKGNWPDTLVATYLEMRSMTQADLDYAFGPEDADRPPFWPEMLLKINDWGCNIYSCADCSKPDTPILRNDNNISFSKFAIEAPSLCQWLVDWLNDKRLFFLDWDTSEKITFS